jgi:hypothetical protein
MARSLAPAVFSYERAPLLLADEVRLAGEDGKVFSETYGLHTFLELTGAAYEVLAADKSRLQVRHLWWKPGAQIPLPYSCSLIFHQAGQWGFGTEDDPPAEWNEVGDHAVFTFNDSSNWDVDSVDFTVGGADPQAFYQTDAWAGFDPDNDDGRSYEEMSDSYSESCEREIRKVIGNAIPENFCWDDLLRFAPEGLQVAAITPEYNSGRSRRPETVILTLSNDERVTLRLI